MTQDEQRIAIAEWMGEFEPNKCKPSIEQLEAILTNRDDKVVVTIEPTGEVRSCRNYPNDLNAMHEAEKKLLASEHTDTLGHNYLQVLWQVCEDIYFKQITVCVATSQRRSEALCRTLWPERFQ